MGSGIGYSNGVAQPEPARRWLRALVIPLALALIATGSAIEVVPGASSLAANTINTLAGGGNLAPADGVAPTSVDFSPRAVTVDSAGDVFIAFCALASCDDQGILEIPVSSETNYGIAMTAGDLYVIAGNGTTGFSGDGGPATSAELGQPSSLVVDGAGNLYELEPYNQRVREIAAASGLQHGIDMTAGDIYTVVGDGAWGFSGDGGPATSASVEFSSEPGYGDARAGWPWTLQGTSLLPMGTTIAFGKSPQPPAPNMASP